MTRFAFFCALILALASSACNRGAKRGPGPYPHESVMSALAEMKIHLRKDPYRFPPGTDLDGRNIFRVTLARLESLDELTGTEYDDVITYARAECLERLGLWSAAAEAFDVSAAPAGSLAEFARPRAAWDRKIADILIDPTGETTLDQYIGTLDARRLALEAMLNGAPEPYGPLIRVELERAARAKALLLSANRQILPRGTERSIETADALARDHAESWRRGENHILLGRIYEQLATEYAQVQDPTRAGFDAERWGGWVQSAREAYLKTAQTDGDPAKPEAQARLRTLDAMAQRVLGQAR